MAEFIVFDVEGTDLDTNQSGLHCIATCVHESEGSALLFGPDRLDAGIAYLNRKLEEGAVLVGVNVVEYDLPLLARFGLDTPGEGQVYDLKLASRAIYPGKTLAQKDMTFRRRCPEMPSKLTGWHSLEAWGWRLGLNKGDYDGGWETYTQAMGDYCAKDVAVSDALLTLFRTRIPDEAVATETEVGRVCRDMRLNGVGFNRVAAEALSVELAGRRAELATQLRDAYPPRFQPADWETEEVTYKDRPVRARTGLGRTFTPKRDNAKLGYTAGATVTKVELEEFNPASNQHAIDRLKAHGWKPAEFTATGQPKLTGDILRDLDPARFPQAPLLSEYQDVQKILGFIAEGENAWLKLEQEGRLHGRINPVGTATLRASHYDPNLGQVPSRSDYGHKCRSLFVATSSDRVVVGADASGLQLRGVGHYLAPMDGGEFARQCETGDVHEYIRQATQLNTRANQKTWTYAKLFGAQAKLLGLTVLDDLAAAGLDEWQGIKATRRNARALGQHSLENFGDRIPAFPQLERKLGGSADKGHLTTLNGQQVPVPSHHLALSVLLQSFEACIMKRAMRVAARLLSHEAKWMLWVHDEFQVECPTSLADEVGATLVHSMNQAGKELGCLVEIDGEAKVGLTWADTH